MNIYIYVYIYLIVANLAILLMDCFWCPHPSKTGPWYARAQWTAIAKMNAKGFSSAGVSTNIVTLESGGRKTEAKLESQKKDLAAAVLYSQLQMTQRPTHCAPCARNNKILTVLLLGEVRRILLFGGIWHMTDHNGYTQT